MSVLLSFKVLKNKIELLLVISFEKSFKFQTKNSANTPSVHFCILNHKNEKEITNNNKKFINIQINKLIKVPIKSIYLNLF